MIRSISLDASSSPLLAVLDDQPPGRGAALAGGQIGRLDRRSPRRLDVLGVPHDERVVAAQFKREDLVRRFGELLVKRHAGARRTGEQQAVDPVFAAVAGPDRGRRQQAHDAVRDAGFVKALDEECAGRGRLFGRLEHDRIAGDQRGDDVTVGQVRGEIYGPRTASTPCGLCRTAILLPSAASIFRCGVRSA